jgi:erythromycin esterase
MRKSLRIRIEGRLAIVAALVVGCAATELPKEIAAVPAPKAAASAVPSVEHGVAGQVRLPDGTPAAGAIVALVPHFELEYRGVNPEVRMVVTDAAGRYAFPRLSEKGRFGVTATLGTKAVAGYGGVHDLAPGAAREVDITLGKDGFALSGVVRDAQGAPAKGARIEAAKLSENEGEVFFVTTDAEGHYEMRLASDASYVVVADVRGVSRVHRRLDAISQTLDLRLNRAPAPRPSDAEIKAFLDEAALPLATLQPGKGTSDLAPLKKMIGDAHIVAIGEAVHGASEYWLLRHRLIEYLTAELGFTTVALEAGWSDAIALDDYITTGRGDPVKGLAALYGWYPNTEETLAMMRWMQRYNRDPAHTKKLRFRGCDVYDIGHAVPAVAAYLDKVEPSLASRARDVLAPVAEISAEGTYPRLSSAEQEQTRQGIRDILASFEANRAKWSARTSESAWATARQHARMVQRIEAVYLDPSKRDRGMADTVDEILASEPRGSKIVVLAQNFHVGTEPWDLSEMGRVLRERHGSDYFVIGTAFGSGAVNAYGPPREQSKRRVEVFALGLPPQASFEAALALAQKPLFALDLRGISGPVADWFSSKIATRWVGGVFRGEENSVTRYAPKKGYDALIYVDKISPSHLTAGAMK